MLLYFIYASLAALFFAVLFNLPQNAIPVAGIFGGLGYLIYLYINELSNEIYLAFFIGTLFVTILSEIAARTMKLTTTTFISIAVIPLVPGLGLYQTMFHLVHNDYYLALTTGIETMLIIITIALSVALTTLLYRFGYNKKKGR